MKDKKTLLLVLVSMFVIILIAGIIVIATPAIKNFISQEMLNENLHKQIASLRQRLPTSVSEKLKVSVAVGIADFSFSKFENREDIQLLITELFKMPEELIHHALIINSDIIGSTINCSFIPPQYNNIPDKNVWVFTITTINADRTVNTCDVFYYDRTGAIVEENHYQGKHLGYFDFSKKSE